MAEEKKDTVIDNKTLDQNAETAPVKEKSEEATQGTSGAPDAEKAIDEALMVLNLVDKEVGGKGEIAEIPEELKNSLGYIIKQLVFVRDLFDDPLWKSILDDMADQKEDGKTPSVEVAIARNIPLEKIQGLAESEDYEGVQGELSSSLSAKKQSEEEEGEYEAGFEASKKAGDEYAAEMGYSEEEKSALFQFVLDLFQVMADGKLTVEEFKKVDKMRNYDTDTEDLRSQIPSKDAKEVLPDQASIDATIKTQPKETKTTPTNTPGLSSVNAYKDVVTDVTQVGSRKRKGRNN
jgi:hypothetical protein